MLRCSEVKRIPGVLRSLFLILVLGDRWGMDLGVLLSNPGAKPL